MTDLQIHILGKELGRVLTENGMRLSEQLDQSLPMPEKLGSTARTAITIHQGKTKILEAVDEFENQAATSTLETILTLHRNGLIHISHINNIPTDE